MMLFKRKECSEPAPPGKWEILLEKASFPKKM
jgi:hypothetical protein